MPEEEWNSFVHDLIYKNRFSSSHKVVDVIRSFSEECTDTIKQGQELYRARIYHKDPLKDFLSNNSVNDKVGEISSNVGMSSAGFSPAVYGMIENISENVIMSIAGIILTFIACYELIQLVISHNNLAHFETWIFWKWICRI